MKKILIFILPIILLSCAHSPKKSVSPLHVAGSSNRISIVGFGDNLIHIEILEDAKETGGFYFDKYYENVKKIIEKADIAFLNQETLVAGKDYGYSGYPAFNGPPELVDTINRLGFDVVNHATNHTMDKGEAALFADMENWNKYPDIKVLGIHKTQEDRDTKKTIITKNNIKVGFLSYTYGLNGNKLPSDKPYLVSLIDKKVMAKEIDELRPLCDLLVVSMHWGNEYEIVPSKTQEDLALFLSMHKVDLVIGHHPHVLQPARFIERDDGGVMLVFFSLGNFLSSQKENARLLGGMMNVTVKKEKDNSIKFENAELLPLVTHYDSSYKNFKIYPLLFYTKEIAKEHRRYEAEGINIFDFFVDLSRKILGFGVQR
ncbi:MAG: CapA family protein [Termitinemataceae bacterium]|nr:MAG: CapA family protein [Termitinemataceae bacterium]